MERTCKARYALAGTVDEDQGCVGSIGRIGEGGIERFARVPTLMMASDEEMRRVAKQSTRASDKAPAAIRNKSSRAFGQEVEWPPEFQPHQQLHIPKSVGTLARSTSLDFDMRQLFALGLSSLLLAGLFNGCTPNIPVKDAFGTSALNPTGNIPPEFAAFNNYDPSVNALLAQQSCATPYSPLADKSLRASPGELIAESGRCEPYEITIGNLREHFLP